MHSQLWAWYRHYHLSLLISVLLVPIDIKNTMSRHPTHTPLYSMSRLTRWAGRRVSTFLGRASWGVFMTSYTGCSALLLINGPGCIVVGTQLVNISDLTRSLDPINLSQNAVLLTSRLTNHGNVSRVADVGVTANLFLDNLDGLVASTPDYAFTFLLWNRRS
jgi:hypothetical protein